MSMQQSLFERSAEPDWWDLPVESGVRWYQQEALERIRASLASNRSCLTVMATGLGKTRVASELVKAWDGRVLFLAHREELVFQARDELERVTGEYVEVEKAEFFASMRTRIVVGSIQTLAKRKERFGAGHFTLLIPDEAHHAVSRTFRGVLDYFASAKVAGITATPDRGDEQALGQIFDEVAYLMDIEDGIEAGYLVPVRAKRVELREIELDEVGKTAGDLAAGQLDEAMKKAVEGIVAKTMELEPHRQGIVFLPGVESAEYCCHKFNEKVPEQAAFASATTDPYERKRIVQDFKQGRYKYLVNCMLYTEGFDAPNASLIVQARPTLCRSLYAQMIGRGTRVLPGVVDGSGGKAAAALRRSLIASSAKKDMVVLDFVGNGEKHRLVTPEDVLGGNYKPEEVEEAKRLAKKEPGQDVRETLKQARSRLREMAAKVRAKKVTAEVRCYDPFHALGVPIADEERYANRFGGKLASDGQIRALSASGVPDEEIVGMSRRAAGKLLDTLQERREAGLATYKQMRQLKRFGALNENVSFERASAAITYLAGKGWGRNGGIDPQALHAILNHKTGSDGR